MAPRSPPESAASTSTLVVRSTKVTAETIAAGDHLGLIVRAGAGTNTIDKQAAAERGVYVCNVPGKNAIAVAELAMGLILALDRCIPDAVADLRQQRWRKKFYSKADGLAGKTLGLVGLGAIGLRIASRATAFRLNVLAVTGRIEIRRPYLRPSGPAWRSCNRMPSCSAGRTSSRFTFLSTRTPGGS